MSSSPGPKIAESPLLETKLFAPRWRPGSVPRPRLQQRLTRGTESKLTLVSAPPGFGKTTVVAEWLSARAVDDPPVAWLSLDPGDNHPSTFWTYVVTALRTAEPTIGRSALALLAAPRPPAAEVVLALVLNEIATLSKPLILVLDDYHVITTTEIHDGVAFLIEHMPSQLHLVVASRADPLAPLARLRARGELVEIRAADLRFSPEEAAAFLNGAMGLDLSADHVAALESRTEGWIAALQLAALSMQGRDDLAGFINAFTGNDRYIVDYLVEEVLQRQPDSIRNFLLQTSILERFRAPLCDAVTGGDNARVILETLDRGNLFLVPLDDKRQWYRYHHLFADVLQSHLDDEQPGQVPILHRQASDWLAAQGQPAPAIRHALAGKDVARAAALVEGEAQMIMRHHQPDRLIQWLKPIPDDLIRSMPVLSAYFGHALQGMGDMEASAARLEDAARWLEATDRNGMVVTDEAAFRSLPSRVAVGRGYLTMASGDVAGTMAQARLALVLLADNEHHWRGTASALLGLAHWLTGELEAAQELHAAGGAEFEKAGDINLATISAYHDAELLRARGRLGEAGRRYERALELALEHGEAASQGAANLYIGLAELCCERNDLESAGHYLRQASALGITPPRTPYRHLLARARLRRSQGDLGGALELIEEAERLYVRGAVPDVRPVGAWKARVQAAQGRILEAIEWTRAQSLSVDDEPAYAREYAHITLARVLIGSFSAEPDSDAVAAVERLLQRLQQAAEGGGRASAVIEIAILQAFAADCRDDNAESLQHFERALALAEPEGYIRMFIDEGDPMRDLLRQAVAEGSGGSYARMLLAAFGSPVAVVPDTVRAKGKGLAEPLTAREVEILRLVAAGMQNQDIADHLVISLFTVKRHIANTYGKLAVGHRTAAVARASELNLL